jgi:hypothetical protein
MEQFAPHQIAQGVCMVGHHNFGGDGFTLFWMFGLKHGIDEKGSWVTEKGLE